MDAPAPGRMPIRLPMIQERRMVGVIRLISLPLKAILSLNLAAFARCLIFFSARIST